MEKELSPGSTTKSSTQDSSKKAKKPVRASLSSMATFTKEISSTASSTEKESTSLQKARKSMKEISQRIAWKERE